MTKVTAARRGARVTGKCSVPLGWEKLRRYWDRCQVLRRTGRDAGFGEWGHGDPHLPPDWCRQPSVGGHRRKWWFMGVPTGKMLPATGRPQNLPALVCGGSVPLDMELWREKEGSLGTLDGC